MHTNVTALQAYTAHARIRRRKRVTRVFFGQHERVLQAMRAGKQLHRTRRAWRMREDIVEGFAHGFHQHQWHILILVTPYLSLSPEYLSIFPCNPAPSTYRNSHAHIDTDTRFSSTNAAPILVTERHWETARGMVQKGFSREVPLLLELSLHLAPPPTYLRIGECVHK